MSEVHKEIEDLVHKIKLDGTLRGQMNHHVGEFLANSVKSFVPNSSMGIFAVYIEDEHKNKIDLNYAFRESRYAELLSDYLNCNIPSAIKGTVRVGIKSIGGRVVLVNDNEIVLSHNGRFYILINWCTIAKMESLNTLNHKQIEQLASIEEKMQLMKYRYLLKHSIEESEE